MSGINTLEKNKAGKRESEELRETLDSWRFPAIRAFCAPTKYRGKQDRAASSFSADAAVNGGIEGLPFDVRCLGKFVELSGAREFHVADAIALDKFRSPVRAMPAAPPAEATLLLDRGEIKVKFYAEFIYDVSMVRRFVHDEVLRREKVAFRVDFDCASTR